MIEERDIRIRALFWYIISHWKTLIIIIVIGALIGGLYSYRSQMTSSNEPEDKIEDVAHEDITVDYLLGLTAEQPPEEGAAFLRSLLSDMDTKNITVYYDYLRLYDIQNTYVEETGTMKMDPYNAYQGQYLYYIESNSSDALDSILAAYKTRLNDLKEIYGPLFSFSTESYAITLNNSQDVTDTSIMQVSNPDATMSILMVGNNKAECMSILNEIDKEILKLHDEISSDLVGHEIRKVADSCYKLQSSSVLDYQRTNIDTLNLLNANMNNTYKSMTPEAQAFVTYMSNNPELDVDSVLKSEVEIKSDAKKDGIIDNTQIVPVNIAKTVSPKWVGLGAAIGLVAVVIILIIIYCAGTKVRYEDDIETLFGIPCFGLSKYGEKKKKIGLDKAIEKARYKNISLIDKEVSAEIIAAGISICIADKCDNRVYATGVSFNENSKQLAREVSSILKNKGIEMYVGKPFFSDALEIEKMGEIGKVVMFENTKGSKYDVIAKNIKACAEMGINTLGIVINK